MDKYTLLFILNLPFVVLGIYKAAMLFQTEKIDRVGFTVRISFWFIVLFGLAFDHRVYDYLTVHGLTDSAPLTIADVILTTGLSMAIYMCFRLYSLVDEAESRITKLNENISILLSEQSKKIDRD